MAVLDLLEFIIRFSIQHVRRIEFASRIPPWSYYRIYGSIPPWSYYLIYGVEIHRNNRYDIEEYIDLTIRVEENGDEKLDYISD